MSYAYDDAGNLTDVWDLANQVTWSYEYDPVDRLSRAERNVGGLPEAYVYGYDPLNNLVVKNDPNADLSLTYPDPGQPRPHAPLQAWDGSSLRAEFTYNANGNRAARLEGTGSITYTYGIENRLTQVASDTGSSLLTTSFVYDGDGGRVKHIAPDGEETLYVGAHFQFTLDEINGGDWGENVAIFGESGDYQQRPNMASDVNGALYLVWIEATAMGDEVRFAVRSPGGNWSPPEVVRAAAYMDYSPGLPVVAVDLDGNVTVAWEEYNTLAVDYDIRVRRRDAAGNWETGSEIVAGGPADEQRPALVADPNGTVYLAWHSTASGQTAVEVARRPISGSWTIEYQTSADPDHFFPSLASDGQGNVYLGYVVGNYAGFGGSSGDVYVVRRDVLSGTWATSPELVNDSSYTYLLSSDPPALAADSHDNLFVAWGAVDSLRLRKRIAATGAWAPIEETGYPQHYGLDLVVDNQDVPQWITGEGADDAWLRIIVNGVNIVDYDVSHSRYPTIALGPGGVHVAVWSARRGGPGTRLFMAVHNPGGSVTKHYYAGGQPLATRADGVLYYTLPDPTGTSLVITKANGDEVGHVLYDGYGAVLTSTLPATLTTTLAGSGDMPDPDTGLVYLGAGRYYDPALGRPLQPNPVGGPPALPQALNRYAATSWGPPGVAEATGSHLHPWLVTAGKGALKTTISATAGRRLATVAESQLPFVVTYRSAGTRLMLIMSRSARYRSFATRAASPFEEGWVAMRGWGRSFRAYSVRGLVTEIEPGLFLTERGQLVETGALPKSAAVLTAEVLRPVNITRFLAGGMFAFALSAGVQYLGDVGNPYLSGAQMRGRVAVAGIGGTVAWGIGTGTTLAVGWFGAAIGWTGAGVWAGPIGIGVGFVAGFVWFGFIQPGIFEDRGLNPKRNLAPLR